ncbi:MAG: helix-turn-helix domain-containing protein [Planctomycetota bacterium]|jgi:DNA-binding IclR family transcriptional regulator|nr:helix-turn-helix domain-containing protein [Planctomycetota bacterium]
MADSPSSPAPALSSGLRILEALAARPEGQSFTDLVSSSGSSKATAVRLLRVLQDEGYVRKGADGRYRIGPAVPRLAAGHDGRSALRHAGAGHLQGLRDQLGNTVLLLHWDGTVFENVAKAADETGLAMQGVGNTCRAYAETPWGWIACARCEVMPDAPPRGFTTVIDTAREALERDGFVLMDLGTPATLRRMAAPIWASDGTLLGCLAVGGNALTITDQQCASYGRVLVDLAARIAADLGESA